MALSGPRGLRKNELDSATRLADKVFRAGGGTPMGKEFPLLFNRDNADHLRVFADKGRIVSLVGMFVRPAWLLGTRHVCCCIGAVCTDPEYRGKGLATRLLEDARKKALAEGVDTFLISGGRGLYLRLDYVDVGAYFTCVAPKDKLPGVGAYALQPWKPEDLPALTRLHAAEPVRFERTPEEFLAVLETGVVMDVPGATAVVRPKGSPEPVAYFSYQVGGRPWEAASNAITIVEMGGSRHAIFRALGALLAERGVGEAKARCLGSDAETAELARSFGWATEPAGFRGTVGIVEPERFWQACEAHFIERLGRERAARLKFSPNGQGKISYGRERVVLGSMSAITRLAFAPAHLRGELDLGLGQGSELARVLEEVFPLPLVDYGLNYI